MMAARSKKRTARPERRIRHHRVRHTSSKRGTWSSSPDTGASRRFPSPFPPAPARHPASRDWHRPGRNRNTCSLAGAAGAHSDSRRGILGCHDRTTSASRNAGRLARGGSAAGDSTGVLLRAARLQNAQIPLGAEAVLPPLVEDDHQAPRHIRHLVPRQIRGVPRRRIGKDRPPEAAGPVRRSWPQLMPGWNDLFWPGRIQVSLLAPQPRPSGDDSDHSWQTGQDQLCPCNRGP